MQQIKRGIRGMMIARIERLTIVRWNSYGFCDIYLLFLD